MGFFKDRKKGLCPECGCEIEDVNDNFCGNCGWKISKFKAIKARNDKKNELKMKKHEEKAQKHKQDFKQSIRVMTNPKDDLKRTIKDVEELKSENKEREARHKIEIKQKVNSRPKTPNEEFKKTS